MNSLIIVVVVVAVLVLIGLAMAIRLVWQYEKGVLFRLGRRPQRSSATAPPRRHQWPRPGPSHSPVSYRPDGYSHFRPAGNGGLRGARAGPALCAEDSSL